MGIKADRQQPKSDQTHKFGPEDFSPGDKIEVESEGHLNTTQKSTYFVRRVFDHGIYHMGHGIVGYKRITDRTKYEDLPEHAKPVSFRNNLGRE